MNRTFTKREDQNSGYKKLIFIILLAFILSPFKGYSQVTIVGLEAEYCIDDEPDTIYGQSPSTKNFGGPGIMQIQFDPAVAVFDPSSAGAGIHQITYFTGTWEVKVVDPVPATLNPFAPVCEDDPGFPISGGSPAGGIYSVDGVDMAFFNPGLYSPGNHFIVYRTTGCESISPPQSINVKSVPTVVFNPVPNVCIDTPPFALDYALPVGGTYTGPGVTANTFDPSDAGVGTHTITYTYSDGSCTNEVHQTIEVEELPVVSFSGIDTLYCDTDPPVIITGSPLSASGTFTGNGITDNGDGTAIFNPGTSGLGYHQITYSYTNATGCTSSYTRQVRVGTLLTFSGLGSKYCSAHTDVNFTYNPSGGTFNAETGLTDNMDGTAVFSPSAGTEGARSIFYTYTDIYGCVNKLEKIVQISPIPEVNFIGLDPAGYCKNNDIVTLSGNHAPAGTFSGPGITDNGDGTAIFNPKTLPVGGPYQINYSYTDAATGCNNTSTKITYILPVPQAVISGNETICIGDMATLNVDFTGTGPFSFTYSDSLTSITITGAPDPYSLQVNPIESATYTITLVTQANGCSNTGTGQGNVTVNQLSEITSHPSNKTACPGENLTFAVSANGIGLSYQWRKDGVVLPGKTNSVLSLSNVQPSDAGSYTCTVTSSCGPDLTSNAGILTVLPQTAITTQPTDIAECEGQNINLSVQATGSGLTYQWRKNGIDITDGGRISGSNTDNLVISGLITTDEGIYTCIISGDCGTETSDPADLSVHENVVVTFQPISKSVCPGSNTSFSIVASGTILGYQWLKNNVNIPGATGSVLTLNGVDATDAGNYRCLITGGCGLVSGNTATLNVYEPVTITQQLQNTESCEGNSVELNVTATGSNLNYQWRKNGIDLINGGTVSGADSPNLQLTNLQLTDAGNYTCFVSGSCGSATTSTANLIVDEQINITTNPLTQEVCPGSNVILNSAANGTNLLYQWYKDGAPLAGETTENLLLNSVSSANTGVYHNMVSNSCGDVTTDQATISLNNPTTINTQPSDAVLCEGENGSFSVQASGSNLSYQWLKDGVPLADGGSFSGTQSNKLIITNVTPADAGVIICHVSGSCGNLNSDPANLTVYENINILSQPQNKTVCPGTNVTFEVSASGSNLSYQWQYEGTDIPGETGNSLSLSGVDNADEGLYHCVITGNCGVTATNSVSLTVNTSVNINTHPVSKQLCEGNNVSFTVSAVGTNLSYQWRKNGVDMVNNGNISGTQTNTLSINNITAVDQAVYSCYVSSTCGNSNSLPADLTVYPQTNIITQPVVFEAVENGNASFSVTAEGHNLSYQWYKEGVALSDDAIYAGTSTSILTLTSVTGSHAGTYYCEIAGTCGSVTSGPGYLIVNPLTLITVHPTGPLEKCVAESVSFDVVASGTNLTYQWKKDGVDLTDDARITGSNTPNLFIDNLLASDAGNYSCLVTGDEGVENSMPAVLDVHELTDIVLQPLNGNKCEGDDAMFVIDAVGTINSYQWKKNGVILSDDGRISGTAANSLSILNLTEADNGTYTCEVSGLCAGDVSDPATLTVSKNTVITSQPAAKTKCAGTSVTFSLTAEGGNLVYQWKKDGAPLTNGSNISGVNSHELTIANVTTSNAGIYSCSVSGDCGVENSNSVSLTVNPETVITTQPVAKIRCEGDDAFFNVIAEGSNLSYEWRKDGANLTDDAHISGSSTATLFINDLVAGDEGTYQVYVSGDCGSFISDPADLTVDEDVQIITQPVGDTKCAGENITLTIVSGSSSDGYQWKKNGVNITDGGHYSGSSTAWLSISDLDLSDAGTYSCLVTGNCNSENSDLASLVIMENISIITQPQSKSVCPGNNTIFSISATGTALSYQWQYNTVDIPGATNAILSLNNIDASDAGNYRCIITGGCGTFTSEVATLTVYEGIMITEQPIDAESCEGSSIELNVTATGSNLNYQWKKDGINLLNGGNIAGANSPNLQLTGLSLTDAGAYTCLIWGGCGSVTTSTAILTVDEQVEIITNPVDNDFCSGEDVILNSEATGTNLRYQWYHDGSAITGEISNNLIIPSAAITEEGAYYNLVSNACGDFTTETAVLTLGSPTTITIQPSDLELCEGANGSISLSATGTDLNYQWLRNGLVLLDGGSFSDTKKSTLLLNNIATADAGVLTCNVTGTCGTLTSGPADLTVNEKITILSHPQNKTVCPGTNVTFEVSASGSNLSYQWQFEGMDIPGETANSLTLSGVSDADEGMYHCVITGNCGVTATNSVSLIVNNSVNINTHPVDQQLCEGDNASFTVSVTGTALTYQWRKNGVDMSDNARIGGTNTNTLTINNIESSDQAVYSCNITGTCGNSNSLPADLTVYPQTNITTQPVVFEAAENGNASFSVTVEGHNLSYQWYKEGVALSDDAVYSGTSTSILTLTNVTGSHAGNYYCEIAGTCGSVTSGPGYLIVNALTLITVHPTGPLEKCVAESVSFDVVASGTNLTYQWKKDGVDLTDDARISGSNTPNLFIDNLLASDAGNYSCLVTGDEGVENSMPAVLDVHELTDIVLQPLNGNKCEGDDAMFVIDAAGTINSYQWKKNGIILSDDGRISGTATNSLSILNLTEADNGTYTCEVSGLCAGDVSDPATLTVSKNTVITSQPAAKTKCAGTSVTFSLTAEGGNLVYQWKKDGAPLTNGSNISGVNSHELTIANVTTSNAGIYSCSVTGNCGVENSNSVSLTVNPETIITTQPVAKTRCEGDDAFFNVIAEGSNLSYEWRKDGVILVNDVHISGSSTATLFINDLVAADEGTYQVYINGTCGSFISDPAGLTVDEDVQIITQPVSDTKCAGENVTLSIVSGSSSDSYQWKKNGVNITDGGHYSGSSTAWLSISDLDPSDAGTYSCLVTGNCNSLNSDLATLSVNPATEIIIQPVSMDVDLGDPANFTVSASGDNLDYQWMKDGVSLTDNAVITGSLTNVLNISSTAGTDAGSYTVSVTGSCGTAISDPAILRVNNPTFIISHPTDQNLCEGQSALFSVKATGTDFTYQWRKNGTALSDVTGKISGSQTENLMISTITTADAGVYTCTVSGSSGTLNSNTANLTVNLATRLIAQPVQSQTKCEGEDTYLTVGATGTNLSYSWEKDGVMLVNGGNLSGADNDILTINSVTNADAGVYRCFISGTCGDISTEPSTLIVNSLPANPGSISGDVLLCQDEKSKAYEVPVITNADTYEWTLPYGASINSGEGTRYIVVDYSSDALSGNISVHGKNSCGTGPESVPLAVTINPVPESNAGFDQSICSNSTLLSANNTSNGTWSRISGYANFADPNLHNTTASNLAQGVNTLVWTVTENNCTSSDTVIIVNNMVPVEAGDDQVLCDMTSVLNASAPLKGTGQWSIISGGANFNNFYDPKTGIINVQRGTNVLKWSVNNNGCISSDTVRITNDLPSNAVAGNDTIILTDSYTLQANTPLIGTGQWSLLSGVGAIQDPSLPNSQVTGLGIGENILKWTISNNSCHLEDEVRIINYTPTINDAGPDQTLCADRTVLSGSPPNYGTGRWTIVQGSGAFTNATRYDTEVYNLGKGVNIFRWTIYEYEVTYDDVRIINNSPSTANAGIDQNLCANTAVLSANQPVVGTGEWSIAGGAAVIGDSTDANTAIHDLNYGSNTFRWTITNGSCSSSDEVRLTNNLPTPANAGVDQATCEDSVTLYPNTPTIGAGEWSVVSGSGYFVGNKAYNLGINDNYFKWTISNKGCHSSDTVVITSHKPTTAYTISSKSICYDSLLLPGNTPHHGTGSWSILSGSADIEDPSDPNSFARNLAQGQNKFRWTISYEECVSFSDVTVNYDLINANAGADQTLCNNTAMLTANTPSPGTGLWTIVGGSGSADFANPDQPNTQVSNLDRGANVLRWTITNNGCSSYDEVTITNNNPSVAYAGADRSVCGESFALNANIPHIGSGEWSVLSGSANIEDPSAYNSQVTNLSLGKNTLRWTVNHEGCISTDEVIILNDQPTNVSAGTDQYICSDSTQLYSSEPVGGYGRWSIAGGSASFDNNTFFDTKVYNLEKGENKLVWTVTISGCSNTDTVVIMNNLPSLPSAGPDQDNCASDAIMAANVPLIGTGKWSVVSGSAIFEDPGDPLTGVSAVGNGNNLLRWTVTNGNCNLSDDVNIINSLPTLAYAGEDRAVCNTTANLLANPPTTGTGTWKVVSGFGVIENPNDYNTQINNLGFGANTIRWTTENGRCKTSDDIVITNNLAEVFAGVDEIVYSPAVTLVGNKPASGIGEWELVAGSGTIENSGNFETTVSNLGEGANTFYWTIDNNGCVAFDDVIINYYVLPQVDFVPAPQYGCPPLTVDFINGSVGGNPFTWDFGDGTTSNEINPVHIYTVPGKYNVRLTGTGPDGIMVTKDTVVIVNEQPDAEMEVTPGLIYISDPPSELDEPVHFFTLTENADSVIWDFGDGTFSNEKNPVHHYLETGTYDINLQVITGDNCYDSESKLSAVVVERKGSIECPNAFTPNPEGPSGGIISDNDYSNDVFHCYGTRLLEYNLKIYSRLGILMFESDDVNVGWDGYFRGKLAEEGVYVYQVSGRYNNGEKFSQIGNVVIIHP